MTLVIALGGNALMRENERGTATEQLANLRRIIELDKPALRVTYRLQELGEPTLAELLAERGIIDAAKPA